MRTSPRTLLIAALFAYASLFATAQSPNNSTTWEPQRLQSGSPCLFEIDLPEKAIAVTGHWQNHDVAFFSAKENNHTWYGLAGIDVEIAPGTYPLVVEATLADGKKITLNHNLSIEAAPYKEIPLNVPDKFVQPSPEALKTIAADKTVKDKVFAESATQPLWSGSFRSPLSIAPQTDSFGTRRVFNGTLASVHRGLDYRAKPGTPVMAANLGRVLLARPLYYEGNCIIIDHGLGVMTIYMHLSHFEVAEGEHVRQGQRIALSGSTGRATGPHLHLGVRWQGAYLDPAKLFKLQLPATR